MDESDRKISHGSLQVHATSFGNITVEGQLVEEVLLRVVQAQEHLSKKHQMHVIPFCQDSTLFFSRRHLTNQESDIYTFPSLLKKEKGLKTRR